MSINRVCLIGNLTRDPELTKTPNDISVCKFSIAVTRRYNREETDFLNIVAWRKTAENAGQYLRKGSKVGVIGAIQIRNYEGTDGVKRYVTEIIADEVEFLGGKKAEEVEDKPRNKKISEMKEATDVELPF